ncbi:MAG: hypothetical protein RI883_2253, partial [Bacteroidota bacterium]
ASVFRKTPVGASYTAGLDLVTVNALQTAAALCVLDSLDTWHLRAKEDISIANFQYEITGNSVQFINSSWRSTDFEWIFDDGSTSVDVYPIHNYAIGGVYDVQLIASSECGDDTLTIQLEIDQLSLTDINQFQYKKKTIESGLFEICGFQNTKIMNVVICDISGKELKLNNEELNDSETDLLKIDLRNYLNGVYFLKITTDVGELVIDLQVSDL